MTMLPDLESLKKYRNPRVIQKFKRDFPQLAKDADFLFVELMKYLWLAQKQRVDQLANPKDENLRFLLAIYDDMANVDHLWHCFILSTHEYEAFCMQYFGRFMHHIPDALESIPPSKEKFAADLEKFASYVYDHLGEETVRFWFGISFQE
jgi:hypothetical protein